MTLRWTLVGTGLGMFLMGLSMVIDSGVSTTAGIVLAQTQTPVPNETYVGPITDWHWGKCVNAGATCVNCTPPDNCVLHPSSAIFGTVGWCEEKGGAEGCGAGPWRAKGTCPGIRGWCPFRDNLCGSKMMPNCPEDRDPTGAVIGCGHPTCTPVGGAGNCSGC